MGDQIVILLPPSSIFGTSFMSIQNTDLYLYKYFICPQKLRLGLQIYIHVFAIITDIQSRSPPPADQFLNMKWGLVVQSVTFDFSIEPKVWNLSLYFIFVIVYNNNGVYFVRLLVEDTNIQLSTVQQHVEIITFSARCVYSLVKILSLCSFFYYE